MPRWLPNAITLLRVALVPCVVLAAVDEGLHGAAEELLGMGVVRSGQRLRATALGLLAAGRHS